MFTHQNGTGKRNSLIFISITIVVILSFAFIGRWALISFLLHFGGGTGNWIYPLPGKYEIWKNADDIFVVERTDDIIDCRVIDKVVAFFCYDERFIGIRQLEEWDGSLDIPEQIGEYYLVDSDTNQIEGPYKYGEYTSRCHELGLALNEWTPTMPAPQGASAGRQH